MSTNKKLKLEALNRLSVAEFKTQEKINLVVVLDNIRSFNNVGSVFRTSDAFLVEKIILCGITPTPPHREITKTALGATESVAWQYHEDTLDALEDLRSAGYKIAAIEQAENTVVLTKWPLSKGDKIAVVLGNEVKGVQQAVVDFADNCIEIAQFGTKHSLNVSVCNGIVLHWVAQKIGLGQ